MSHVPDSFCTYDLMALKAKNSISFYNVLSFCVCLIAPQDMGVFVLFPERDIFSQYT